MSRATCQYIQTIVLVTPDMRARLERLATAKGVSLAKIGRDALDAGVPMLEREDRMVRQLRELDDAEIIEAVA